MLIKVSVCFNLVLYVLRMVLESPWKVLEFDFDKWARTPSPAMAHHACMHWASCGHSRWITGGRCHTANSCTVTGPAACVLVCCLDRVYVDSHWSELPYIVVFTQNVQGTEWPFMCWCAGKKLLTHWLTRSWCGGTHSSHPRIQQETTHSVTFL